MPNSTPKLGEAVKTIIERDAVLKNGLARDLINIRALARYIQVEINDGSSLEAIVSTIRRLPVEEHAIRYQKIGKLILSLSMKNKIADVAIINDPKIPLAMGKISGEIDYGRGETFRIVAGKDVVKVIIDEKNLSKVTNLIPKQSLRDITENLTEIIVTLDKAAEKIPGVLAAVANEIAICGINIVEFLTCVPELILVIDEKDGLKSYETLQRLSTFN